MAVDIGAIEYHVKYEVFDRGAIEYQVKYEVFDMGAIEYQVKHDRFRHKYVTKSQNTQYIREVCCQKLQKHR